MSTAKAKRRKRLRKVGYVDRGQNAVYAAPWLHGVIEIVLKPRKAKRRKRSRET